MGVLIVYILGGIKEICFNKMFSGKGVLLED